MVGVGLEDVQHQFEVVVLLSIRELHTDSQQAGVNIMHLAGKEFAHYFGVSGTFLAHFVSKFSTFCDLTYVFGTFLDIFSKFWHIFGLF